jgi:hypothetical protein
MATNKTCLGSCPINSQLIQGKMQNICMDANTAIKADIIVGAKAKVMVHNPLFCRGGLLVQVVWCNIFLDDQVADQLNFKGWFGVQDRNF